MSFLTGGSKSESKNLAYPYLKDTFGGTASGLTQQGQGGLSQYLATLSGTDKGAGYNAYKDSTGYNNIFNEAIRGVSSSAAAKGLLASGSTVRALADRGGQLAQQNFGNYLQQLLAGSQAGLQGGANLAGIIGDAGKYSYENKKGSLLEGLGSLGKGIGSAAVAFSDRALKTDVALVGRKPDGLGVYEYRYLWDEPSDPVRCGVMADEVAELRPQALGPVVNGYATVDYGAL